MNTIQAKIPAYGMPALEGPVNKPEKVNMMPPMGDMPGPGEPGGPGDMPPMPGAPAEIKPCPPTCRARRRCGARQARPRLPRRRPSQGTSVP